ncbi:MAG TPA: DedA family protein [Terriglobales bacterium]|nr:DedA family protein [Terriglobales bacterium]
MHLFDYIRQFLAHWGYWSVAAFLLLENAGVPLPGETILILASVLAFKSHELRLPWIILIGTLACTFGDNAGYWIGNRGGRPLLERWKRFFHVKDEHIRSGEDLLRRHGAPAIFFARFIAGARIVAGPLAGVLRMEWRRFALFNFLGALSWVSVIAGLSYLFGSQLDRLLATVKRIELAFLIVIVAGLAFYFWRSKRPSIMHT